MENPDLVGHPIVWRQLQSITTPIKTMNEHGTRYTIHYPGASTVQSDADEVLDETYLTPWRVMQVLFGCTKFWFTHCDGEVFAKYFTKKFYDGQSAFIKFAYIHIAEKAYAKPLPLYLSSITKTEQELLSIGRTSYCHRYSWYTESGDLIGNLTGMDVLVDLKKRKPVEIPADFLELFGPYCRDPGFKFSAVAPVAPMETDHKLLYPITDRDVDGNKHVNFNVYVYVAGLAVKQVWEELSGSEQRCKVGDIHITMLGEFTSKDTIYVYTNYKDDVFHVSLCDSDMKQKVYMKICTIYNKTFLSSSI